MDRRVARPREGPRRRLHPLDPRRLARLPRMAFDLVRVLVLAAREFLRDNGLEWAAALSFTTLLALVPLAILAFLLLGAFEKLLDIGKVENLLVAQGLPDAAQKAGEVIQGLIERFRSSTTGLGIVGGGFLVVTALGLYSALERAFNRVWKIRRLRSPLQRFRSFWLVISLGPVLFGVSVYVTARLQSVTMAGEGTIHDALRDALRLLPFALTWATFFIFYVYLPNTRVRVRSALLGAVLAGSAWEVAKWGFNAYVANAVSLDRIYGTLGMLPVFVIWIYVTWVIGLAGAEIAYVHQHHRAIAAGVAGQGAELGATRELMALGVLLEVYRPFREGSPPPDLADLSRGLVVRAETVREILLELEKAGLVRRDAGGQYLPAREATRITLAEGVAAARGLAGATSDLWESTIGRRTLEAFDEAEERRAGALEQVTLEDVLAAEVREAGPPA